MCFRKDFMLSPNHRIPPHFSFYYTIESKTHQNLVRLDLFYSKIKNIILFIILIEIFHVKKSCPQNATFTL